MSWFAILLISGIFLLSDFGRAAAPLCEDKGAQRSPSSVSPAKLAGAGEISVLPVDPRFNASELLQAGYQVKVSPPKAGDWREWQDPSPSLRDEIFSRAGLTSTVSNWDHFAKDMLFLRAQKLSVQKLSSKYRDLSPKLLQALQKQIHNRKLRVGA